MGPGKQQLRWIVPRGRVELTHLVLILNPTDEDADLNMTVVNVKS